MLNDKDARRAQLAAMLPLPARLPDGRQVMVSFMTGCQLTETYNIIRTCAEQSDGFGLDEFRNEDEFRSEVGSSDCFAIVGKESGEMLAAFILTVSKFYRGSSGAVDPYILVHPSERRKGIGLFCLRTIVGFSQRLGFDAMYIDTFCNNGAMMKILDTVGGFTRVGYLPLGGKLRNGMTVGSYIYYRSLLNNCGGEWGQVVDNNNGE
ncbi:uncharacterized protein LOC117316846 [Pecten maximus]|uniref:uncharacterized protein LOC117316846 n=1 Tax=Pecten maximus TaxID=6579 RepID=UPI00145869F1|nr:uncharacterized protein LOC117316846 [Pecten maximus]XP_033727519.1 uncharacterized protein LOC117316846 [Pecten maximus]